MLSLKTYCNRYCENDQDDEAMMMIERDDGSLVIVS